MQLIRFTSVLLASTLMLSSCSNKYLKKFHKEAKGQVGTAKIKMKADTVRVIYPELAMFDFNKDEIKPEAKSSLERFATLLRKYDRINFIINGYTDNVGTDQVNNDLSQRRAESAKALFIANNIASDRMQTNGRGSANPIMDNTTEEGRQANRRVELLLYEKK